MKHFPSLRWIATLFLLPILSVCSQLPEGFSAAEPLDLPTAAMEREIHELINRHRAAAGLGRLAADPFLTRLAREHSAQMAEGAVPVGHEGFEQRFEAARSELGILRLSENVASNYNYPAPAVPSRMVTGWIDSAGHRDNLEGAFRTTGVGVARSARGEYFGTQLFAAP